MKVVKLLVKLVVGIVVIVLVALLSLPLWFGPVVKTVANAVAPDIVKADFRLGHLSLNPYTARFELGDLSLANPEGYAERQAVSVGEVSFDAETLSLATDVIHIEEIKVKDVFASYVSGGPEKVNNFQQFQYNLAGGKEKYEAAQAKKKSAADAKATQAQEPAAEKGSKSEKKFIIDRLEVSGIKVQYGVFPLKVPLSIVLTDIGRKSGGATLEEAWNQIWAEILKAGGSVGDQIKSLSGSVGEATKQATDSVKKLSESLKTDAGAKAVGESAKAVGEGAKKALDSIKKLW